MIFHPPVLALLLASALTSLLTLWASFFALRLLAQWDLASGSETQLRLERQTYLVSTVLAFVMAVELASLVLFVFNADRMAVLFVGAMCAVGTLNASVYGFPALLAKIAVFFAAGLWLAVNHADAQGRDYPLIRIKYKLLLGVAPLVLLAAGLQLAYFLDLKADTITSCCGKMFTPEKPSIAGEMAGWDVRTALVLLYAALAVTLAAGLIARIMVRRKGSNPETDTPSLGALRYRLPAGKWKSAEVRAGAFIGYGVMSAVFYAVALAAVISVISLYVYEHPHHHCPFCLLKQEYGYFGFFLYMPLFAGAAFGLAVSFLGVAGRVPSLEAVLPGMLRRFLFFSMAGFALFGLIATWEITASKLILFP